MEKGGGDSLSVRDDLCRRHEFANSQLRTRSLLQAPGAYVDSRLRPVKFPTYSSKNLLGQEQMNKYLGGNRAVVQVTTWNRGSKPIPKRDEIRKLLIRDYRVDIHVVTVQECWRDEDAWIHALLICLRPDFALMQSERNGSLHISVLMRRELLWFVTGKPTKETLIFLINHKSNSNKLSYTNRS